MVLKLKHRKKMGGIEFGMGELEKAGGALYLLVACRNASPVIGGQDDVVPRSCRREKHKVRFTPGRSLNNHQIIAVAGSTRCILLAHC